MILDKTTTEYVNQAFKVHSNKYLRTYSREDREDLQQDCYVAVLKTDIDAKTNLEKQVAFIVYSTITGWLTKEGNRRRLERDNAETIVKNTTPTVLLDWSGGPEEFIDAEQVLVARWKSLSPLLRRVAKRTFFGYMEAPEKVATDLGMTVAAVNMARTRIKQHMNGVK